MKDEEALMEFKDEEANNLLLLVNQLKSEDAKIRLEAAETLGKIKSARVVELLFPALLDEDWQINDAAFAVLVSTGEVAVPVLLNTLKNCQEQLRGSIAGILGEIGNPAAFKPLLEIFQNKQESSRVRACAAGALGALGNSKAISPLIQVFNYPDTEDLVRASIIPALGMLDKRGNRRIFDLILGGLNDPYKDVRSLAVSWLGIIGNKQALPYLEKMHWEDRDLMGRLNAAIKQISEQD